MKIESINAAQINSIASPLAESEVKPSTIGFASEQVSNDTANLSQVAGLVAKAMEQPAIRMDKVQTIKAQIAAGNYEIDASKIAEALISSAFKNEI